MFAKLMGLVVITLTLSVSTSFASSTLSFDKVTKTYTLSGDSGDSYLELVTALSDPSLGRTTLSFSESARNASSNNYSSELGNIRIDASAEGCSLVSNAIAVCYHSSTVTRKVSLRGNAGDDFLYVNGNYGIYWGWNGVDSSGVSAVNLNCGTGYDGSINQQDQTLPNPVPVYVSLGCEF